MTYSEALAYIASLEPRGWRLGLDRMFELVRRAGLEGTIGHSEKPQFIHIAGTNGKGTTTAFVQAILTAHGHKTGAFFSPFVNDPRERIQIDGQLISETDLARLTEQLIPISESFDETDFGGVTEFEFKTALGFMHWAEQECDWVALEVGLGGRFDATNVVVPTASAITSIGLDHTSILGETIEKIAFEKAGVIKPGVPVVLGELPQQAMNVAVEVAEQNEPPIWRLGEEYRLTRDGDTWAVSTPVGDFDGLRPTLKGTHVAENMAIAISLCAAAGIELRTELVQRAVAKGWLPGRFEVREFDGRRVVLDGAHNLDAARSLAQTFESDGVDNAVLVTGMVQGHDPVPFYQELARVAESAHFVPIDFHRAVPPADLLASSGEQFDRATAHETLAAGMAAAIRECPEGGTVLVAGSFYLVGEAGRLLPTSCSGSR